jgi:hypothetical protein
MVRLPRPDDSAKLISGCWLIAHSDWVRRRSLPKKFEPSPLMRRHPGKQSGSRGRTAKPAGNLLDE